MMKMDIPIQILALEAYIVNFSMLLERLITKMYFKWFTSFIFVDSLMQLKKKEKNKHDQDIVQTQNDITSKIVKS